MDKDLILRFQSLLSYDPDTGALTWRPRGIPRVDTRFAGKRAGFVATTNDGYPCRRIQVDGKLYQEHRVIWSIMTSDAPPEHVDHINQNALDNRWCNLSMSTPRGNQRNKSLPINNTSGVCGVTYDKRRRKWLARIGTSTGKRHLGSFSDIKDAEKTVIEARAEAGFSDRHGVKHAWWRGDDKARATLKATEEG